MLFVCRLAVGLYGCGLGRLVLHKQHITDNGVRKHCHPAYPCDGVCKAKRDIRRRACLAIDCAAVDCRRQKYADSYPCNKLYRARQKREKWLFYTLRAASPNKSSSVSSLRSSIIINIGFFLHNSLTLYSL